MKNEKLEAMVDNFDAMIRNEISKTINGFCDSLVIQGGKAMEETADGFRRHGWVVAADFCVKKMHETRGK